MEPKKTCGICSRLYKVGLRQIGIDEWCLITETSHAHIKLRGPDTTTIFTEDICPICAMKLIDYVKKMKRDAPTKCEFCEHDLGPKHPDYRKGCECCSRYSNFQLKKRMSDRQKYEWDLYNGEV